MFFVIKYNRSVADVLVRSTALYNIGNSSDKLDGNTEPVLNWN